MIKDKTLTQKRPKQLADGQWKDLTSQKQISPKIDFHYKSPSKTFQTGFNIQKILGIHNTLDKARQIIFSTKLDYSHPFWKSNQLKKTSWKLKPFTPAGMPEGSSTDEAISLLTLLNV